MKENEYQQAMENCASNVIKGAIIISDFFLAIIALINEITEWLIKLCYLLFQVIKEYIENE